MKGIIMDKKTAHIIKASIGLVLCVVILYLLSCAYVIVESGNVGVVTHFGAVQDEILQEGMHVIMPVKTKVVQINARIQIIEADASASSKDLQIVTSKVALNYYLSNEKANRIYQKIGLSYKNNIIKPAIQESVKSSTAQFTAEQLITKRPQVKESIFQSIKQRLQSYDIIVTDFSIIDFKFSPDFNKAIEDKQVAEQRALRSKNDLERIKTEAEQARVKAEGEAKATLELAKAEAEAQKLVRETLTPQIIKLRAIEKWNGKLPQVSGGDGSVPFIEIELDKQVK